MYEGDTIEEILEQVTQVQLKQETFRVNFVKINDLDQSEKIHFEQRREMERSIGLQIDGEPDLDNPDVMLWYRDTWWQMVFWNLS